MVICNDCCAELTDANWSPSYERERIYVCRSCAVARTQTYERTHQERRRQYNAEYYKAHKAACTAKSTEWRKGHRDNARETQRRYHSNHFEKRNAKLHDNYRKVREEVLQAYGHACGCCGEDRSEFLAIDHVHNDGAVHRREIGSGKPIYFWLKKHGCPKDGRFALSCHNCNNARGFYGYCPHERQRTQDRLFQHD